MPNSKNTVGIIGAGLSSLFAACYLSKAGYKVTVFEKNLMSGGRSQTFEASGFKFDMGPSWYWMPDLIDSLLEDLDEKRNDWYTIERLETAYQVYWKEGEYSAIPSDKEKLLKLFESFEVGGGAALSKFLDSSKIKYDVAKKILENPGLKYSELLKWDVISNGFKLSVFKSVEKDVAKRFKSEKSRSLLNFPVLFLGAMPDEIPALYTLMNYADLELGTWYPKGGMRDLAISLEAIASKEGATFHYNTPVLKITSNERNEVSGITTSTSEHHFDYVISGADYEFTEQTLLDPKYRKYDSQYWNERKLAPSSLLFYIGCDQKIDHLSHHNLFFDEDLVEHGKTIYESKSWPEKPLFYACVPSKTDPTVAPEGKENLFLLIPLAPDLEDSEAIREKYFDYMIEKLKHHTGQDISNNIEFKRSFCVSDFKSEYNSFKGNAYGLANTLKQTANLKPSIKSKLKNLYFRGQLTVPGPGVPPALISGKIAATQIINSHQNH